MILTQLQILRSNLSDFFSSLSHEWVHDTSQQSGSESQEQEAPRRRKKQTRALINTDEERPKAPTSSFLLYYHENKQKIAEAYNESNAARLTRLASKCWKELPNEERLAYVKQSEQSKERYHKEMVIYRAKYAIEIEEAMKKRRAEYRNNWLEKKKAQSGDRKASQENKDSPQFIKISDEVEENNQV